MIAGRNITDSDPTRRAYTPAAKEIVEGSIKRKASISRSVVFLEKRGVVRRIQGPDDVRQRILDYNEDDCVAMWVLVEGVHEILNN